MTTEEFTQVINTKAGDGIINKNKDTLDQTVQSSEIIHSENGLSITIRSPKTISLIKLWGRLCKRFNIPLYDSISLTLSMEDVFTETTVTLSKRVEQNKF